MTTKESRKARLPSSEQVIVLPLRPASERSNPSKQVPSDKMNLPSQGCCSSAESDRNLLEALETRTYALVARSNPPFKLHLDHYSLLKNVTPDWPASEIFPRFSNLTLLLVNGCIFAINNHSLRSYVHNLEAEKLYIRIVYYIMGGLGPRADNNRVAFRMMMLYLGDMQNKLKGCLNMLSRGGDTPYWGSDKAVVIVIIIGINGLA